MRTKEEILDPYYKQNNNGLDEWVEYSDALKSMEIYAKEVAIAFSEWVEQKYLQRNTGEWFTYDDHPNRDDAVTPRFTTKELFNQFIQSHEK
jgi:hypothetical protein